MAAKWCAILSSSLVGFLVLGVNAQIQAQRVQATIDGAYQGTYQCMQRPTNLTLSLHSSGNGGLTGVFTFYLPPSTHAHPYSYSLRGTVDAVSGQFRLSPVGWEGPAPRRFMMVGLQGVFDAVSARVSGRIANPVCGAFQAIRTHVESSSNSASTAPGYASQDQYPVARSKPALSNRQSGSSLSTLASTRGIASATPSPNTAKESLVGNTADANARTGTVAPINASSTCERVYAAARHAYSSPRDDLSPLSPEGDTCRMQLRDSGISGSPVGIMTVRLYSGNGPSLASYSRPSRNCQTASGLGQMADLCLPYKDPTELSLVVYRNDKRVLELNFTNWPSARDPSESDSRQIAAEILGPDPGAVLKPPVLSASAAPGDRAGRLEKELTPKAQAGDVNAQFALAAVYQFGAIGADNKLHPDYRAAAYWYQQAAAQHMQQAAYALGLLYRDGLGVNKDEDQAIKYMKQAVDQDNVAAMVSLAMIYVNRGLNWDQQFAPLLRRAQAAGSAAASNELGAINFHEGLHEPAGFEGRQQSQFQEAMSDFKKAVAGGDCDAMLNIGGMYFNGSGVPQSAAEARAWFLKARDCHGASDDVIQKSNAFLTKIQTGHLPAVRVEAASGGHSISGRDALIGGLVLVLAAGVAHDMSMTPEERKKDFDRINAQQDRNPLMCWGSLGETAPIGGTCDPGQTLMRKF